VYSDTVIVDWVRADFGLDLVALDEIHHGADVAARVWRGVDASGSAYAIKHTSGGTVAGLTVSDALRRPGIVAPLRSRDGLLWTDHDGARLSVLPWISDRHGRGGLTQAQWRQFGALLAAVHAAPIDAPVAAVLPEEDYRHRRAAEVVRAVHARLDVTPAALDEIWDRSAATALLAAADRLAAGYRDAPGPAVICHSDPHLANVLIADDGQPFLIDWDDAIRSPRERDLMFVLDGGLIGFSDVGDEARSAFFDGYGDTPIDRRLVAYFQCVRALEDLGYALTALDPRASPEDRESALGITAGVFSDTGLGTIAARNVGTHVAPR
jgi:spectinomycin phosphotransferase